MVAYASLKALTSAGMGNAVVGMLGKLNEGKYTNPRPTQCDRHPAGQRNSYLLVVPVADD